MYIEVLYKILENVEEKIIITDIKGDIKLINKSAREFLEIAESNNQNICDEIFISKENLRENHISYLIKNKRKYLLNIRGLNIENYEYLYIVIRNEITNDELIISHMQNILDKATDGIVVSNNEGKIIYYNNAMEKLENKRSDDMIGKYLWDAYGYGVDSIDKSEHRKVFETGKPIRNRYSAHAYDDGKPKYVSYSTYPIIINDRIEGVYSLSRNETKLHELLSETMELRRKFIGRDDKKDKDIGNGTSFEFSDIIGSSDIMIKAIKEAQSLAWTDNNILIVGDTGTGKEVFAQSIHNYGKRRDQPFIGINCSAIPENLLESTLFGTVKGAYTGAIDSKGLFLEAEEGTLFLDELNSMPIDMQTKLLRVIQEREVRPVGGVDTFPINCRIISAMNEEPLELIKDSRLREDLYYRIAGFTIFLLPLRKRKQDIMDLTYYYIDRMNKKFNKNILGLTKKLESQMMKYPWPGNVRELEHFLENMMIKTDEESDNLDIKDIPDHMTSRFFDSSIDKYYTELGDYNNKGNLTEILEGIEKKIIEKELEKNDYNVSKTARELGIIRQSLIYRIKKLDIKQ